jgi:hypothetical protein
MDDSIHYSLPGMLCEKKQVPQNNPKLGCGSRDRAKTLTCDLYWPTSLHVTCIYLESPLPFVFGVVCKTHLFWVRLILFGVVSCKKAFYLPSRCWLYTLSITKLNHVSVLFLSCVMLDQAPSHIIQTQAHN